jgi:hypothetical protein
MMFATRATGFSGSSKIWISEVVKPIHAGTIVHRGRARSGPGSALVAASTDGAVPKISRRAGTADEWNLDFDLDSLLRVTDPISDRLTLSYTDSTSVLRQKSAALVVTVNRLELTRDDPENHWPMAQCSPSVQACLDALPLGTVDTEPCGDYHTVTRCNLPSQLPELGLAPDDLTALNQALAAINAVLPSHKRVAARDYYVQGYSSTPPPFVQVRAAFAAFEQLEQVVDRGALTSSTLTTDLAGFGAQSLVPAAQQVVFQNSFQAHKLTWERMVAPGAMQWTTLDLLYFPAAGRLVVFELVEVET